MLDIVTIPKTEYSRLIETAEVLDDLKAFEYFLGQPCTDCGNRDWQEKWLCGNAQEAGRRFRRNS